MLFDWDDIEIFLVDSLSLTLGVESLNPIVIEVQVSFLAGNINFSVVHRPKGSILSPSNLEW
jgi:hypothetical protein